MLEELFSNYAIKFQKCYVVHLQLGTTKETWSLGQEPTRKPGWLGTAAVTVTTDEATLKKTLDNPNSAAGFLMSKRLKVSSLSKIQEIFGSLAR